MEVIQNPHVGVCRAEGKVKGQRRVKNSDLASTPYFSYSTCPCMCTYGCLNISGENLAFSSWWEKTKHRLIYREYTVYNAHTYGLCLHRQMERWCSKHCAFLRFHHVVFLPMFPFTYSMHVCLYCTRSSDSVQSNPTPCTVICKVNLHLSQHE